MTASKALQCRCRYVGNLSQRSSVARPDPRVDPMSARTWRRRGDPRTIVAADVGLHIIVSSYSIDPILKWLGVCRYSGCRARASLMASYFQYLGPHRETGRRLSGIAPAESSPR